MVGDKEHERAPIGPSACFRAIRSLSRGLPGGGEDVDGPSLILPAMAHAFSDGGGGGPGPSTRAARTRLPAYAALGHGRPSILRTFSDRDDDGARTRSLDTAAGALSDSHAAGARRGTTGARSGTVRGKRPTALAQAAAAAAAAEQQDPVHSLVSNDHCKYLCYLMCAAG
jgi:hypothetical protein